MFQYSIFVNILKAINLIVVYLDVSDLSNKFETEKICEDLGNVIDY